jgi:tetratricopeptide (TPR) repeat protein
VSYHQDAFAAFRRGETDLVEQLSRHELARARESADVAAEVEALCMLARVAVRDGDVPEAERLARVARALARGTGERRLERTPTHIVAGCARISGNLAFARTLYQESISLNETFGEWRMVAMELHNLAYIELHAGHVDHARELFTTALRRTVEQDIDDMLPYVALDTAVMAAVDGDHPRAARLLAALDNALRTAGQILDPDDAIEQTALRERLITTLGRPSFDSVYAAGAGLGLRDALDVSTPLQHRHGRD